MDDNPLLYVKYKILKELLLVKVFFILIYGVPLLKKLGMEATCNFFLFLVV
jgi:hypothetical protein